MNISKNKLFNNFLLLLTAFIWGIAFVAQSIGMDYVGPSTFVFSRFLISAAVLAPITFSMRKKRSRSGKTDRTKKSAYLIGGMICGLFLGFASLAQQAGIQYTTTGKAGFITALYVILVPILGIFLGKFPEMKIWIAAVIGLAGLYLISMSGGFSIERGDALVILCAFLFSMQILSVDHFSGKVEDTVLLANCSFIFASIVGLGGTILLESPTLEGILGAALPILYAGAMSGAVGYTLQIVAQKNTDPTVASLLMSLESVFSALAGWAILGERMNVRELSGCALVFAAVIFAQIRLPQMGRVRSNAAE